MMSGSMMCLPNELILILEKAINEKFPELNYDSTEVFSVREVQNQKKDSYRYGFYEAFKYAENSFVKSTNESIQDISEKFETIKQKYSELEAENQKLKDAILREYVRGN